jgi:hypothetical protein
MLHVTDTQLLPEHTYLESRLIEAREGFAGGNRLKLRGCHNLGLISSICAAAAAAAAAAGRTCNIIQTRLLVL